MIPFNLVFRKHPLSEARSLTSDSRVKDWSEWSLASSIRYVGLEVVMAVVGGGDGYSRCQRLTFLFNLYAGGSSGSQDGGHY